MTQLWIFVKQISKIWASYLMSLDHMLVLTVLNLYNSLNFNVEPDHRVVRLRENQGLFIIISLFWCAQHGIGAPSLMVILHEILKLLHYAEASDVKFFRIGTSGGLGN